MSLNTTEMKTSEANEAVLAGTECEPTPEIKEILKAKAQENLPKKAVALKSQNGKDLNDIQVAGRREIKNDYTLRQNSYGMYTVHLTEGGTVPARLSHMYTSAEKALADIQAYEDSLNAA